MPATPCAVGFNGGTLHTQDRAFLYTVKIFNPVVPTPEPSNPPPGRYHHGDLRRALIDAARDLLEAEKEVTLRAVARRAGVSHAAPYHHFTDRRALVSAVAVEGLLSFRDALQAAVERYSGSPPMQLLESGVAYVRFAVQNPSSFRLMFSSELADRAGLPELEAAYAAAYGILEDAVRCLLGHDATEPEVAQRALAAWAVVHGLAHLILDNQVHMRAADIDAIERLVRSVLRESGVGGGPPPSGAECS